MMSDHNTIVKRALSCLGKGFDLTSDFRLKFCKGDKRLIVLNETNTRQLRIPGFGSYDDVSVDIKCDKGDRTRYQSDILDFNQMSELFNQKSSVPGKIPSGFFNSMFGFQSGSWAVDAANTKYLGLDGYFIVLFSVSVDRYPLILSDEVRNDVPSTWDPSALARFIEKYGTHIIVGLSIGGQDLVLMKQETSSKLEPSQLKKHLDNLCDQLFTGACKFSPKHKQKAPSAFDVFDPNPLTSTLATKDGISVICSRRGGEPSVSTHCEWLLTVPSKPDVVHFSFIPITSLLKGVTGKGFLSHAINLYLRYKPSISDLQYFLDFQAHKIWAPIHSDLPLGPPRNKTLATPSLQFNLLGPKLYVNTTQVTTGNIPVTGMRLYLEGMKCDRLGIHLQHLTNRPVLLQDKILDRPTWHGSEDAIDAHRYFEPIQWKKFSHVCTAPVKYDPSWADPPGQEHAFIVTGAQLHVKKHGAKSVLHLRLLFSKVASCYIVQSNWMSCTKEDYSTKISSLFSTISATLGGGGGNNNDLMDRERSPEKIVVDSGVYPSGPPKPVRAERLVKFVDTSHMCRGPSDNPGYWVVSGAKLDVERGKICLRVKFTLLNLC